MEDVIFLHVKCKVFFFEIFFAHTERGQAQGKETTMEAPTKICTMGYGPSLKVWRIDSSRLTCRRTRKKKGLPSTI